MQGDGGQLVPGRGVQTLEGTSGRCLQLQRQRSRQSAVAVESSVRSPSAGSPRRETRFRLNHFWATNDGTAVLQPPCLLCRSRLFDNRQRHSAFSSTLLLSSLDLSHGSRGNNMPAGGPGAGAERLLDFFWAHIEGATNPRGGRLMLTEVRM